MLCLYENKSDCEMVYIQHCERCHQVFSNSFCFGAHREPLTQNITAIPETHSSCKTCVKHLNRLSKRQNGSSHLCNEYFCTNCEIVDDPDHLCYIRWHDRTALKQGQFVFADLECD